MSLCFYTLTHIKGIHISTAYTHTHTHTHTNTHTHTRAHTYTHTCAHKTWQIVTLRK